MKLFISLLLMLLVVNNGYAVRRLSPGDYYGGGTVFCVSDTQEGIRNCSTAADASGEYGLIMANEDQANSRPPNRGRTWSLKASFTGAQSLDDGAANTQIIITARPKDNDDNNAAWLCHNYRDLEWHTDWYLPAKNELNKMYIYARDNNLIGRRCTGSIVGGAQCFIGGWGIDSLYWSSTEDVAFSKSAYVKNFYHGHDYTFSKNEYSSLFCQVYYLGVRAIRAFDSSIVENDERQIPMALSLFALTQYRGK